MAVAMDTGIAAKDRAAIAGGLSRLLADTYVLYLKTHNFHWNVEGPMFQTLHQMFMSSTPRPGTRSTLSPNHPRAGPLRAGSYKQYVNRPR